MIRRLCMVMLLAGLMTGCQKPQPRGGGWDGPLVDPDGQIIQPPTYEAAP